MAGICINSCVHFATGFILLGFQSGYGSGAPIRSSSIVNTLHGIRHFFAVAGADFPSSHPHIRMLLKGISRLDPPHLHKAPVSLELLESCFKSMRFHDPSEQGTEVCVMCLVFFFLLRRSEIVPVSGSTFQWFAIKAQDISILDDSGTTTRNPALACSVHVRLHGSMTN